jgi:hypothetical protein
MLRDVEKCVRASILPQWRHSSFIESGHFSPEPLAALSFAICKSSFFQAVTASVRVILPCSVSSKNFGPAGAPSLNKQGLYGLANSRSSERLTRLLIM